MNEDDADQGTGLDTKYRIDSAQGESVSIISFFSFPSFRDAACGGHSPEVSSDPSPRIELTFSIQQDCHYRTQVYSGRGLPSPPL